MNQKELSSLNALVEKAHQDGDYSSLYFELRGMKLDGKLDFIEE